MARSSESAASALEALYDQAALLPLEHFGSNLHVGYWEDAQDDASFLDATERLTDMVIERLRVGPGRHTLDIGCGVGGPALRVARATGSTVVGVNISRAQLAVAHTLAERESMTDRLTFTYADASALPFDADSFDAVWALESVPHMDRALALREMARVVRPGGRIVITDMFERAPVAAHRRALLARFREAWSAGPLVPIADYPALLRDAGLRLVELTDLSDHVLSRSLPALDASLGPLSRPGGSEAGPEIGDRASLADLAEGGELGYLLLVAEPMPAPRRARGTGRAAPADGTLRSPTAPAGAERPSAGTAVLGTGRIGDAIARTLVAAGYPTSVWNRTTLRTGPSVEAGAQVADCPARAAAGAELLVVCVSDYEAVLEVIHSAGEELAGRTLLTVSTLTPDQARASAQTAAEYGAEFASVPVMAGYGAIGKPETPLLFAGPRAVFDRHGAVLRALGGAPRYVGDDPGLASLFEVAVVSFLLELWLGYLHTLSLVRREGGTPEVFASVLRDTLEGLLPQLGVVAGQTAEEDYAPEPFGHVTYLASMTEAMIDARRSRGVDTTRLEQLGVLLDCRVGQGFGEQGLASLMELIDSGSRCATSAQAPPRPPACDAPAEPGGAVGAAPGHG
ncbi:methyltransferase domain-containing protein [Streptomyces marincola]|uniref:Polyketide synthase-like methyltransferase domain-containing protein n=1 Tax=Streptomyces marincola TaxID=2878388 RepID=A0A1W7CSS8_9ACTN|nr:methyltransferase domain-containing protein [Streptomyces marincola]ARQ67450.1 hypothetical protein CAG99_00075 [Streptomyces marincola]